MIAQRVECLFSLAVLIFARSGHFRAALENFHRVVLIRALRSYEEDASKVRDIGGILIASEKIRKFDENQVVLPWFPGCPRDGFPEFFRG